MKWEYLIWQGAELTYSTLEKLGAEGWELVSLIVAYPAPHKEKAVFKRPKAEEAKP